MSSAGQCGHDPILEAVGWVTAAGAAMEWTLVDQHKTLLGGPRAHVAVAGESFETAERACLHLAKWMGQHGEPELAEEIGVVVKEAGRVWELRGAVRRPAAPQNRSRIEAVHR